MKITDLTIQKLKPPEGATKQKTHFDDALKGFGVRVSIGGSKTFVVMYGKRRKLKTLGRYPDLTLAEARKRAKQLQGELAGLSDTAIKVHVSPEFNEARRRFLDDAAIRTKASTLEQYRRPLEKHFNFSKPVGEVTRQDIMNVVAALKDNTSAPRHAFVAIRTMMSWCLLHGLIDSSPVPPLQFKAKSRTRILTNEELKTVCARADEVGCPYGTLVQLLILTGQRRGEIAGLRRSWIKDGTITFPAGFCKNKREHVVPLCALAQSLIDSIPGQNDLLFPARGAPNVPMSGWSKFKREFDKPLSLAPYTLHDLRRTFASNLAALGTPIHVTEKLLNHVSGSLSGVAGVYNRYSYAAEMRQAVEAHEAHIRQISSLAKVEQA